LGFAGFGVFRGLLKSLRVFVAILMVRFFITAKDAKDAKEGKEGIDKNLLRALRVLRGLI
jgi:hypothetical protein